MNGANLMFLWRNRNGTFQKWSDGRWNIRGRFWILWESLCRIRGKTLGEYHDLYLKSDVLLLADVFENFRKTRLEYYKLDPCHYFSAPGLAWDACLKMTSVSLELISDIDKYLFIEKGLRGGVSIITHRKATANNRIWNLTMRKTFETYRLFGCK